MLIAPKIRPSQFVTIQKIRNRAFISKIVQIQ